MNFYDLIKLFNMCKVLMSNGTSLQSASQYVNNLLVNVNTTSDSSVSDFISVSIAERKRLN